MKKYKIFLVLIALLALVNACQKDTLSDDSIFQESSKEKMTAFDYWILSNYTYPYNISFKYKMEDIESSYSYDLSPASPDKSLAAAKIIKYVWIETMDEIKGVDFLRLYAPKVIYLVGSNAYTSAGTIILGTAEGGMKITLYDINSINLNNPSKDLMRRYMKTIFHEFAHILHQTKDYPPEFAAISKSDYIGSNWSSSTETEALAFSKGFLSRYSRSEPNEDFVEIFSSFVVYGDSFFNSVLSQAGTEGANKLREKFEILTEYLNVSWNIDIYELQRVFQSRLASIDKLDLKNT